MHGKKRTVIESFNGGELVLVLLHEAREVVEQRCTLGSRSVQAPYGVEGLLGDFDRSLDVFPGSLGDFGDDLSIRWIYLLV